MGSEDSVSCSLDRGSLRLLFEMFVLLVGDLGLLVIYSWPGTNLAIKVSEIRASPIPWVDFSDLYGS